MPTNAAATAGQTSIPNELLMQLLQQLAQTNVVPQQASHLVLPPSRPAPNIRPPVPFHGTDSSKLRPFLSDCRLAFRADEQRYSTDEARIMYAGSYLESVAKKWFEPFLYKDREDPEYPAFLISFKGFEDELIHLFGDPDEEATAEHNISRLRMRDNHQVSRYITDFRLLQVSLNWDDKALCYQFRRGLAPRILDELAHQDRPKNLKELQAAAQKIDIRYWERQRERHDFGPVTPFQKTLVPLPSQSKMPSRAIEPAAKAAPSNQGSHTSQHLTRSGKLTPDEYRRRLEKKLCLYCGEPGHTRDGCPKAKNLDRPKTHLRSNQIEAQAVMDSVLPPTACSHQGKE